MKSLRMGLVLDRHLEQLSKIMNHARRAFASRPPAADFFASLETVVDLEKQRRHHNLEGQWDETPWQFDLHRLTPSSQVCLLKFFEQKKEEFCEEEPPVASFFQQVADYLQVYMEDNLPEEIREEVESARQSVQEDNKTKI